MPASFDPNQPPDPLNPLVSALLSDLGLTAGGDGGVCLEVDPRDEMLGFLVESRRGDRERALYSYFHSGHSIADAMTQVLRWRFGEPGRVGRLLDFASGYGRVTRFLLQAVPAERIWVSDIYEEGVRFQQRRFGVNGIVSSLLPEDFATAEPFDAVLVTSLFTHLAEARFIAWLRALMSLLRPGGVLAFSVHGEEVVPAGCQIPPSGILFQEISESGTLAGSDYGSAWVSEGFVRRALHEAAGGEASLHRLPLGLCNYQDLYIALPGPRGPSDRSAPPETAAPTAAASSDFSRLLYRQEPGLFVERFDLAGTDLLSISGWAGTRGHGSLREVQVLLDGEPLLACPIELPRPDVARLLGDERYLPSGWSGSARLPPCTSRGASVVRLRVADERGVAHPAGACCLESALLDSSRLEVGRLHLDLFQAHARLDAAAAEISGLQDRIAAMEASRFWKLRNRWFQLKGLLGLGPEASRG